MLNTEVSKYVFAWGHTLSLWSAWICRDYLLSSRRWYSNKCGMRSTGCNWLKMAFVIGISGWSRRWNAHSSLLAGHGCKHFSPVFLIHVLATQRLMLLSETLPFIGCLIIYHHIIRKDGRPLIWSSVCGIACSVCFSCLSCIPSSLELHQLMPHFGVCLASW